MSDAAGECALCSLPTPDPPVSDPAVEGAFCCRGCLEVARSLGPEAAPATVDPADASTAGAGAAGGALDTGRDPDAADGETAYLAVEGMHCATCELFLEDRATAREGVTAAAASYATGLLQVVYDPDACDPADLPAAVSGHGYRARLASAAGPAEADDAGTAEAGPTDGATDTAPTRPTTGAAADDTGRLLVGGFFGMMVMLWYVLFLYPAYLGLPASARLFSLSGADGAYLLWNVWAFGGVVLGYTGFPILRGAVVSLRARRPNMDLLVALAATTAFAYSTLVLLTGGTEIYVDVSVAVVLVVTLGNRYESRVRERAAGHLADLTAERVEEARRRGPDGEVTTTPVGDLAPGDEVVVGPDERVPVDGTVVEGSGAVDRSLLTGEATPVRREAGEEVVGGARVTAGGLVVAVDGGESTLDRLVSALWAAQATRPGVQRLADRLAAVFVPAVVALALAAGLVHVGLGATPSAALITALAVLVVSCPCALGLATPLAVAAGTREALERGIVVADGTVFERAPDVDVVALDKTGTLTTGAMAVRDVVVADGTVAGGSPDAAPDRATVLRRAAALERFADHPVARAVVDAAGAERLDDAARAGSPTSPATDGGRPAAPEADSPLPGDSADGPPDAAGDGPDLAVEAVETHPGRGVSGTVEGSRVAVGSTDLFAAEGWTVPDDLADRAAAARDAGDLPALVGWDGRAHGLVVAGDEPREGWRDVVDRLADDRRVVVLSGDGEAATRPFADHPGVDEAFWGVPPEAKAAVVERLGETERVAMVGDGSNDAPALAAADVGVALESGTRLAVDAADVVVTRGDLDAVPGVFALTAAARRRVRENLGWAFVYNAVAVPLAALGLVNPLLAAGAMAASSLLVVGNSARSMAVDGG
ncbi:MAG: heavy metal translocating P-type ATPase [Halobacteriaceae archaeon]